MTQFIKIGDRIINENYIIEVQFNSIDAVITLAGLDGEIGYTDAGVGSLSSITHTWPTSSPEAEVIRNHFRTKGFDV